MSYFKKHKKGFIGSTIFHLIILILLIWLGFFTPLPLPGEEGIMVNFGTSNQGLGETEPSPAKNSPPVVKEEIKEVVTMPPPPATTPPPVKSDPVPETPAEEVAMTQDYEKTVAIDAAEKKKKEEADRLKKQKEEDDRIKRQQEEQDRIKREAEEKERLQQEELERQRLAEIERQRQAELERQRLAEIERQRQEEEARKINEINSRTKNAFENSGNGGGETGSGSGESQGTTYPGGNQGAPTGSPNSSNYGEGGSGSGDQDSGISYSLSGRTARSLPKPAYPGNEEGTVVVQVTVDKNGNVTKAEAGVRGSTTMNSLLLKAAKDAALKAKFNIASNAPAFQVGSITYKFSLQ